MKKLNSILALSALAFLFSTGTARSNIDVAQGILEGLNTITSAGTTSLEMVRKAEQLDSARKSGSFGSVVKNFFSKLGFKKKDYTLKIQPGIGDVVKDPNSVAEKLGEENIVEYGKGYDTSTFNNNLAKNQQLLFEELASMYAASLVTHADLLKKNEETPLDQENERELIQATKDKSLNSAARLSRIVLMEAIIATNRAQMRNKSLQKNSEGEE